MIFIIQSIIKQLAIEILGCTKYRYTGTCCTHLFYSLLNILGQNILTVLTAKYTGVKCTPSTNQIINTCTNNFVCRNTV